MQKFLSLDGDLPINSVNDWTHRLSPLKLCLNFTGRQTGLKLYLKPHLGVCHGDDLFYLFPFGVFGFPKTLKTASDKNISKWMLTWISNFAAKSDPGSVNNVEWLPVEPTTTATTSGSSNAFQVLRFDEHVTFGPMEESKQRRIDFWNNSVKQSKIFEKTDDSTSFTHIYNVIAERRASVLD